MMNKVYNSSNLKKHTTTNPLKKYMIKYFNNKLINIINSINTPKSTILDAGCGEGFISNLLVTHIKDAKIYAIDSNQDAINYACKHQSPEIYFSVGNIYNIDAQNDSFNIVYSTEVLEHIHHPEDALKELLRVAQNYVLISVPQEPYFCLGNLLSGKNILRLGNPIDHIHCYTFNGIKKFIKKIFPDKKITLFNCIVWTIILIEK